MKFPLLIKNVQRKALLSSNYLPNMAEFKAVQTVSRFVGHNCQPKGLDHGFEYAIKLNAS